LDQTQKVFALPSRQHTESQHGYPVGMNLIQKLRSLHTDIAAAKDGFKVVDGWALAERLLLRHPVDVDEASRVFDAKDIDGLDRLIDRLEHPEKYAPGGSDGDGDAQLAGDAVEHPPEELAAAMRAFRKRLKIVVLNDESRLGGRYTSGGRVSSISAIQPPDTFPPTVWKALVRDGQLKDTGRGFYTLA
jgi:hypothetical protein